MNSKTLKGPDFYAAVSFNFTEPRNYRAESARKNEVYHTGQVDGKYGFTCTPEFYKAWKAGTIAQATFSFGTYQPMGEDGKPRVDPVTGDVVAKRESASLGNWFTVEQLKAQYTGQKELILVEAEFDATKKVAGRFYEKKVAKDMGLTGADVKAMLEEL